jgi:hypothetical protein
MFFLNSLSSTGTKKYRIKAVGLNETLPELTRQCISIGSCNIDKAVFVECNSLICWLYKICYSAFGFMVITNEPLDTIIWHFS